MGEDGKTYVSSATDRFMLLACTEIPPGAALKQYPKTLSASSTLNPKHDPNPEATRANDVLLSRPPPIGHHQQASQPQQAAWSRVILGFSGGPPWKRRGSHTSSPDTCKAQILKRLLTHAGICLQIVVECWVPSRQPGNRLEMNCRSEFEV
eukprot:709574-Rhodomonas_salina.2